MPPKQAKKSSAVAKKKPTKNKPANAQKGKVPKANKTKTKNAKRKVAAKKRQAKRTKKKRKEKKKTAKKKRKATKAKKSRAKKAGKKTKKKKSADKKKKKEDLAKKEQQPDSDAEDAVGMPQFKFKFTGLSLFQIRDLREKLKEMTKEEFLEQLRNYTEERGEADKVNSMFMGSPEERMKLFGDQEKPTDASAGPFRSNRYGAIFLLPGE